MSRKFTSTPRDHDFHVDREFDVLIEEDETGWFVASVPSLPGCMTQGRSVEQAKERVRDAIVAYLAASSSPGRLPFRH